MILRDDFHYYYLKGCDICSVWQSGKELYTYGKDGRDIILFSTVSPQQIYISRWWHLASDDDLAKAVLDEEMTGSNHVKYKII
jgi:hypothetical protein